MSDDTATDTTADAWKGVYKLPMGAFSASDRARLMLASEAQDLAEKATRLALLLAHDPAEAGDYAAAVRQFRYRTDRLTAWALTAEVARGTSWERITDKVGYTRAGELEKWREEVATNVESMNSLSSPTNYGTKCWVIDRWIAGLTDVVGPFKPKPIGPVLDASAPWTGRDAAKANRVFTAGLPAPREAAAALADAAG
ncbi:hypothetical protein ACIF6L_31560 [Kitasatospora sp. NPDC086009]|uniref:hypothetical protein n=1 Tax=unclassified Kitasatospora TaxID=2633591 RepID=UPI0037C53B55